MSTEECAGRLAAAIEARDDYARMLNEERQQWRATISNIRKAIASFPVWCANRINTIIDNEMKGAS